MRSARRFLFPVLLAFLSGVYFSSCNKPDGPVLPGKPGEGQVPSAPLPSGDGPHLPSVPYDYVQTVQQMPAYLSAYLAHTPGVDNTPVDNPITNTGATLGRVLFYDKHLSVNDRISCGSCHHADKAFTDGMKFSTGFDGRSTRRNAMSTVNLRFFMEKAMFWDMRAGHLEVQTLMPVVDPVEMGMSGLRALEVKLGQLSYYPPLFQAAFGSPEVTEERMRRALSQFLRSIVSFRSKYDEGLENGFVDFNAAELRGKRIVGGMHCGECHSDLWYVGNRKEAPFLPAQIRG
ncbi:cytochrome-c peroxidase [Chitinophaga pendula]|uniref:cytochrome-c peroxidase n=1 Tax=Chitinophaga TaxID=79328 RepID=UPI000BAF85A2|nr:MULTISPECIES: cytochrome-c peroxidase [Chitinophaga]ASZ11749.1 hypothetical protein CK934_12665 [Chitinophaga sp. MD30]UCJ05231.1 cytochrome-c peroxidase [Chitinophaga pendula]